MALQTGIFNINTGNPAELNKLSFAQRILRLYPNGSAPLYALTASAGKSTALSSTHGYFSKTLSFINITLAAGVLIGATSIVVPSTAGIVVGTVLFNPRTRENVRVTAIPDGVTLTVTRAFGRIVAAAMNIADKLIQIGSAFEEGSARPAAKRLSTEYIPNFTQIFRNAWALTDTARASLANQGIDNIAESARDCTMFHSIDMETAMIWGQAKMDTTGQTPIHATQGLIDAMEQYCPGNTNTALATTTFQQLITMLEPAFKYSTDLGNPNERVAFCGSTAMKVLHEIGRLSGVVEIYGTDTDFGMRFSSFKFYKGVVHLKEHPLFNDLGASGSMLVIDPAAVKLAFLGNRDAKVEEYGKDMKILNGSGADAVGGSLTSELAVELVNPYSCAYIDGLTAAA